MGILMSTLRREMNRNMQEDHPNNNKALKGFLVLIAIIQKRSRLKKSKKMKTNTPSNNHA